jgi:hypothetical protein
MGPFMGLGRAGRGCLPHGNSWPYELLNMFICAINMMINIFIYGNIADITLKTISTYGKETVMYEADGR